MSVSEEAIYNLALRTNILELPNFFVKYPEFDYLLTDTKFLEDLALKYNLLHGNKFSNLYHLTNYFKLSPEEISVIAVEHNDYDDTKRLISKMNKINSCNK